MVQGIIVTTQLAKSALLPQEIVFPDDLSYDAIPIWKSMIRIIN
jgi:hypothetical protein